MKAPGQRQISMIFWMAFKLYLLFNTLACVVDYILNLFVVEYRFSFISMTAGVQQTHIYRHYSSIWLCRNLNVGKNEKFWLEFQVERLLLFKSWPAALNYLFETNGSYTNDHFESFYEDHKFQWVFIAFEHEKGVKEPKSTISYLCVLLSRIGRQRNLCSFCKKLYRSSNYTI